MMNIELETNLYLIDHPRIKMQNLHLGLAVICNRIDNKFSLLVGRADGSLAC